MKRGGWSIVGLLLFACSEATPSAPSPAADAGAEAAAPRVDASSDDACVAACGRPCSTPTLADLSRDIDNLVRVRQSARSACTAEDLALLEAKLAGPEPPGTYLAYGDGLGEACRACVVSKDTDLEWGPVVATSTDPSRGLLNVFGCYGVIEGQGCGQAVAMETFCQRAACDEACAGFAANTKEHCPDLATTRVKCATIMDSVRVHCAAPPVDGGTGDGG